ncbi:MAG TPA: hypothetical protein DIC64_03715, partial [Alphaproteobacteria bacterium]|nr:hypothetical protein [Alphaproteobacteria bacterium]
SLIEIPIFVLIIVLAVINDDYTKFTFKPFDISVTVSLSVLILCLFFIGYFIGRIDGYVAGAPLRAKLRENKKAHKALNKEHEKLTSNFSHLQEDFQRIKASAPEQAKVSFLSKLAGIFKFKKD